VKKLMWIPMAALLAGSAVAQDKVEPAAKAKAPIMPLRVQVVVSSQQGDKKVSSRPYSLTIGTGSQFTLRHGTEVPIAVTVVEKDGRDATSFQYKNVGVNMEFTAEPVEGGRYRLFFAVEFSSLFAGELPPVRRGTTMEVPAFETFTLRGTALVRDGETASYSSTAPVTGEVGKIDVTLTALK
jgi:Flp pilus assembly secretin CpaC